MYYSKYALDRNNAISSMLRTQYAPDFFVTEYYILRNTTSWRSKDLATGSNLQMLPILRRISFSC
jgi:hypothetical protein